MAKQVKPRKAVGDQSESGALVDADRLGLLQGYLRTFFTATEVARPKWMRDYDMAEGGGKQWLNKDRLLVQATGRPALEFNQILPQVELVTGMQRGLNLDFGALPRGLEDRRLGEIATGCLKAATEFGRVQRVTDKVFDDGTICGLGVWEVLHSMDDADDLVWGDITVSRINPLAFIWDVWSTEPDFQDGEFAGKATWLSIDAFNARYPGKEHLAKPGEWLARSQHYLSSSAGMGTGPNLLKELYDHETGRIRLLTMWHKVHKAINLIIDSETGQVQDVASKNQGEEALAQYAEQYGKQKTAQLSVITQDATTFIVDNLTGQPVPADQQGTPLQYADPKAAYDYVDQLSKTAGMEIYDRFSVVSRKARVPEYTEMVWWEILDSGKSPNNDRLYPYVPYVSRQLSDDPESIMGIVRNLQDPQDEYNKRYSNILAHLNSSAHSGWMNRRTGGANKSQLELLGSKPGIVVEYGSLAPVQIRPVELSTGHFSMLQHGERSILRISGVNAEMVGQTTQSTVSGRAIRARQEGGSTILKPRFRNFEEAQLDLARMILSRIQQYYPVEKIKRIIGVTELSTPLGAQGQPLFSDPTSGQPLPDDQVMTLLTTMKNTRFDLVLNLAPATATERQAQFEQAVQLAGLLTSSGKPLGSATLQAMIDLSEMPTRLAEGLKRDAEQEPMPGMVQPGGQNEQVQRMIENVRGGRAGGGEGVIGSPGQ
jgi:hypothetical protein